MARNAFLKQHERSSKRRSDVVLLCFSVASPRSLKHCRSVWFPEIRRACPQTPIVLVGCKNDLRHLAQSDHLNRLIQARRPFLKPITPSDLIYPDQGRSVAREIGAVYYEASVYTFYGINDVFVNVIRAALTRRRETRIWQSGYLNWVRKPRLQFPYLQPKPEPPVLVSLQSSYAKDAGYFCETGDVSIVFGNGEEILHQKLLLASISRTFAQIFICENSSGTCQCVKGQKWGFFLPSLTEPTFPDPPISISERIRLIPKSNQRINPVKSASEHSISTSGNSQPIKCFLFSPTEPSTNWSCAASPRSQDRRRVLRSRSIPWNSPEHSEHEKHCHPLHHPRTPIQLDIPNKAILSVEIRGDLETVFLDPEIEQRDFEWILRAKITGKPDRLPPDRVQKVTKIVKLLEIQGVTISKDGTANCEKNDFYENIADYGLDMGLFSDMEIIVEDGVKRAHRFILVSRCEVMRAMLSSHFIEGSTAQVIFPGLRLSIIQPLLHYLYTDQLYPGVQPTLLDHMDLLEVANRLCLNHLHRLLEVNLVHMLQKTSADESEICEDALLILEPAQMYNAVQLSGWCLHFIATNYLLAIKTCPRLLKTLSPSNAEYITTHRWPPIWYLKDQDYCEKALREQRSNDERLGLKRVRSVSGSGCLCLKSSRRHNSSV